MGHLLFVAKHRWLQQEMRNTFYFGGNDAVMTNAQAITDALAACWSANLLAYQDDEWTLYGFDVYDKTIPSVPGVEYVPTGGALVGTNVSEVNATQLAGLVTFKAQVAPPNTNRKYLPGLNAINLADSLWNATVTTAMQAWGDQVLAIPTATGLAIVFEVVILLPDGTVSGGNPLTSAAARNVPGMRRSRRIGVGI